ncbi:MAG: LytR/AlgR family response regulator transcription factor [Lachnospiraceae bacterium]
MLRALILEDNEESRKALTAIISGRFPEIEVDAAATYAEAEEFLLKNTKQGAASYDIFLLDINLISTDAEDASGLRFAKQIRTIHGYEFTPIVMITSVSHLEMAAYREVHCYQYIIKPFVKEAVISVLKKLLEGKKQEERHFFVFKKDGINYKTDCNDILFLKAVPRGIAVVLRKEEIKVPYLTLRNAMEKLPEEFVQCHRMYVVNLRYVEYFDFVNQVIRLQGCEQTIEIGGTYKAELKKRLEEL